MRKWAIKLLVRAMLYLINREEREYTRVWHRLNPHAFMALCEGGVPHGDRLTYHLERNPRYNRLVMDNVFPGVGAEVFFRRTTHD